MKVKITARRGYADTEGRRTFSLDPFATSAQEGGGWSTPPLSALLPVKHLVLVEQKVQKALGLVWTGMENLISKGI